MNSSKVRTGPCSMKMMLERKMKTLRKSLKTNIDMHERIKVRNDVLSDRFELGRTEKEFEFIKTKSEGIERMYVILYKREEEYAKVIELLKKQLVVLKNKIRKKDELISEMIHLKPHYHKVHALTDEIEINQISDDMIC